MSYIQTFSSVLNVSGSVTVHYPPSEHGGTVTEYYQQNVPVNMNVTVNTAPFDQSVQSANYHVDGLTASVAAMNAANCAAIAECSEQVSDGIISGFYNLIRNDISTKKAETNTLLQTKTALLLEHSKAVTSMHSRMLKDFEREKAKYSAVISELDKELERRVTELNKPAFRIGKKVKQELLVAPFLSAAAETADSLGSHGGSGEKIAISGIREKVSGVLQRLGDLLFNNLHYREEMRNALWNRSVEQDEQQAYIPVAYCVSEGLESSQVVSRCFSSDVTGKERILEATSTYLKENGNVSRPIPDDELNLIEQAFSNMVQDNYTGLSDRNEFQERVYSEMLRMWKSDCPNIKQG